MIEFELIKEIERSNGVHTLKVEAKVGTGEILMLYGKSGAGKTTVLRMIAGLTTPDSGRLCVAKKTLYDSALTKNLKSQQRGIAYVFQDNALFPNLNVLKNVLYGCPKCRQEEGVEVLTRLGIENLAKRRVDTLSGGQKKRVAIGRALAMGSEVILLDEPFSSLDIHLKMSMYEIIRNIRDDLNKTVIMVSHDIFELSYLADKILVFSDNGEFVTTEAKEAVHAVMGAEALDSYTNHVRQLLH